MPVLESTRNGRRLAQGRKKKQKHRGNVTLDALFRRGRKGVRRGGEGTLAGDHGFREEGVRGTEVGNSVI